MHWHTKIPRFPKFSVSSDRNIRDHLWRWSTYFGCFTYVIRKKNKKRLESDSSWLAWFSSEGAGHSIFLGYLTGRFGVMEHPAIINTKLGHYAHFGIFRRESFGARKKRLAARRLGSQARKIASPSLLNHSFETDTFWSKQKHNNHPIKRPGNPATHFNDQGPCLRGSLNWIYHRCKFIPLIHELEFPGEISSIN